MYVSERDQVNYHGFLKALRDNHDVIEDKVCKGICTVSGINRFENGNRIAEKLMRDRLTARLGIASETYEEYLQPKEYKQWQQRLRIVNLIEKRNLKLAYKELDNYANQKHLNHINVQFVEAMRYNILELEGASNEILLDCVNRAVKCTIPNVKKALDGEHLLADQEINLIMEQMRLTAPKKTVRDINAWRIKEYEKLITYIDNSQWEDLQKAKMYPKLSYYISKCILEKDATVDELKRGMNLCNTAMELLRDTSRLYYFIEMTEVIQELGNRLMETGLVEDELCRLQSMLKKKKTWGNLIRGLYEEFKVRIYMSDFCYLYYETECHNMVKVIKARRNMLGLSRPILAQDVCTDRTIIRLECEDRNPTIELVRRLFEKIGMCAEYRRARIITTDVEALKIYDDKLVNAVNDFDFEKGMDAIGAIKERIDMSIPYNKQELQRMEYYLLYNGEKINSDQFIDAILEALEYTITKSALYHKDETYFTIAELICIHDIAFNGESELSVKCLKIIENAIHAALENDANIDKIKVLEPLMERLASKLGDAGKYEESCRISDALMKECLSHYRMKDLANPLYNKIWNYEQSRGSDRLYINHNLNKCVLLCEINKKYNVIAFFQDRIK